MEGPRAGKGVSETRPTSNRQGRTHLLLRIRIRDGVVWCGVFGVGALKGNLPQIHSLYVCGAERDALG